MTKPSEPIRILASHGARSGRLVGGPDDGLVFLRRYNSELMKGDADGPYEGGVYLIDRKSTRVVEDGRVWQVDFVWRPHEPEAT